MSRLTPSTAPPSTTGYWPASTAAFHLNADIADAVRRYVAATADQDFEQGPGLDVLVATARLWRSLGHHGSQGTFDGKHPYVQPAP